MLPRLRQGYGRPEAEIRKRWSSADGDGGLETRRRFRTVTLDKGDYLGDENTKSKGISIESKSSFQMKEA